MFAGFAPGDQGKQEDTPKLGFGLASRRSFLVHKASFLDENSPSLKGLSLGTSPVLGVQKQDTHTTPGSDANAGPKDQASTAARIANTLDLSHEEALALCGTAKAWLGFAEGPCHDLNLVRSYALFVEKQVSSEVGIQASLAALSEQQKKEVTRLICNPDALQLPDRSLQILSSCPNINFLILTPQGSEVLHAQPAPACWQNLRKLLAHLPELTCIDISNCGCTDTELEAIAGSCQQLQGIDLSFNPGISDAGIEQLLGSCKQLQELDLSNCCSLTSRSLLAVASACSALNTLYLEQREVDEESSEQYSFTAVTAQGLAAIAKGCPALKVLSLAGACLTADEPSSNADAADISAGTSAGTSAAGSCLAALASSCSELSCLDLTSCHAWLTEQHLLQAAPHMGALTALTLTGGAALTDAAARLLAAHCTSLQQLTLLQCSELTDEGLVALLAACKALNELQVAGCHKLSAGSVAALAGCAKLARLEMDLTGCSGTSLDAVQAATKDLPLSSAQVCLATGTLKVVNGQAFISNAWSALMGFLSTANDGGGPMMSPCVRRLRKM